MTVFVALLRAINVGGTGMLPMKELAILCTELGFNHVRTYIQSGNVIFDSPLGKDVVTQELAQALGKKMGKPVDVLLRTAAELRTILKANPFPDAEPSKVAVVFCSANLPKDWLELLRIPGKEEVEPGKKEIYIHYPEGMGRSKLKLPPSTGVATVRNINTVTKLLALAVSQALHEST
jgi:uncharacterized protein (DUF1697 family)